MDIYKTTSLPIYSEVQNFILSTSEIQQSDKNIIFGYKANISFLIYTMTMTWASLG